MRNILQSFPQLPDIIGRPLPPIVSIILPVARTNLVTNPSVELATTGYTAVGGLITRTAGRQFHGTYSLNVALTNPGCCDGVYYGPIALTSGTTYAVSVKFQTITPGLIYELSVATTGGVNLTTYQFTGVGRGQWVWLIYTETSSTNRRIYVRKNDTRPDPGSNFWIDGLQVEACGSEGVFPTTYIDGDQQGLVVGQQPPAYSWAGTPHASTSTRSALTRAGGRVMRLDRYGLLLTAIIGLGLATPTHISTPYSVLDGARYQRTQKAPRTFSLMGRFQATTQMQLSRQRSDLRQVLDRDYVSPQQPLLLQIEPRDEHGQVSGPTATIPALYSGGLEGNETGALAEEVPITFTTYLPFLTTPGGGGSMTVQQTVANANQLVQRAANGTWSTFGATGGAGGTVGVRDILRARDGTIYVCGDFTSMGGVADTAMIAKWDGSAWSALGTGGSGGGAVYRLVEGPNGDIYATGNHGGLGGVANTAYIARWDGSAWNALGTGTNGAVYHAAFRPNTATLYAVGDFTTAGGGAASRIAAWDGSAWAAVGGGGCERSRCHRVCKYRRFLYRRALHERWQRPDCGKPCRALLDFRRHVDCAGERVQQRGL